MKKLLFVVFFFTFSGILIAQQGKNGSPTITTTVEVNEYTYLTANANAGSSTISVANSTLNAHGRFSANLAAGDLIMIIQMQGATLNGEIDPMYDNVGLPEDSSWGSVTNYNNCGNYEFAEVSAVPSGTSITLDCPLQYNYIDTGRVQIVRVPRYSSLTINSGGKITCDQWDSAIGGIISIEVENNTIINSGGSINADSAGFRGGQYHSEDSIGWGVVWTASTFETLGKEKGEGIGGYERNYTKYGGKECMGAPGNAGGGGNVQNGGGGGGANGGVVANYINGFGNPDVSTANNIAAWAQEFTWMPTFTSSGGGRGGYTFASTNISPQTNPPNNVNWGGDHRGNVGGRGGRPLDYSTGKIFMAGGGGAGDQNNGYGGTGGKGGGMVYLMCYGTVSGAGQIIANGENGKNTPDPTPAVGHASGIDGAGGAGGGGTIIVNSVGNITGISLSANGGTGGNQVMNWNVSTDEESEGPGGGGGGGYIASSNTGLTETATGGVNGTTNAIPMANFPPNGATIGGGGTTGATITNFYITAQNDTICGGQSANLTATLHGTFPGGTTIEWYTVSAGGTPVATGLNYTTPVLTATTTYYVGSCPGTYRVAVTVVVSGSSSVSISPNKTICKGTSDTLVASGGTAYSWSPVTGLSNANIANPIATPSATTTYSVSITTPCGVVRDSVKVTVSPLPSATISAGSNPVCPGVATTLTAGGGTSYSWNTGGTTSSITVSANSTTTYTVIVSNGACTKDTSITLNVNTSPTVTVNPPAPQVCGTESVTLNGVGASSYTWSPSAGLSCTSCTATIATPTTTTTYTVIGTNASGCTDTSNVTVTVNLKPVINIAPPTPTICSGGNVALVASGASTYTWTPSTNLTCTNCSNPTASPTITTTYTVIGTSGAGCADTTTITVGVSTSLIATISPPSDSVCAGSFTTLTAGGGATYLWSTGATTAAISVNPNADSTYSVVVSSSGCADSTSESVHVLAVPVVGAGNNDTICPGGSTLLTASGASSYTWRPAAGLSCTGCISPTANPTVTTTYTVVGLNASGCKDSTTVTVAVVSTFTASITPISAIICAGDSAILTASGGGTYQWSNGATSSSISVKPNSTNTYKVVVYIGSCKDSATSTVNVNPLPSITITHDTAICSGNTITLSVSGGGTYLWSNTGSSTTSSISVTPASTTTYTAEVTSSNGCTKDTTVTITVTTTQTLTITPTIVSCYNTPDTLAVSGTGPYLWSNGATTSTIIVNPGTTQVYSVSVGAAGCSTSASDTVKVKSLPVVTLQGNPRICKGDSAILIATGGGSYLWSPGGGTNSSVFVSPDTTTLYTLVVTKNGCEKDTVDKVTVYPIPIPAVNGPFTICKGESVDLAASGGATYEWTPSGGLNNSGISDPTATPGLNTVYTVTMSNSFGCSAEDSIRVIVTAGASGIACCSDTIHPGGSQALSITGAASGSTFSWAPAAGLSCTTCSDPTASPNATTMYTVTITDSSGCIGIDSVLISIESAGCGNIFVPTAFSPDITVNNILYVRGDCIASMEFDVFDRWGNKVFISNSINHGWDGNYNNQPMNMGTYVYYLKVTLMDGTTVNKKGNVTLFR